jgi:hypothetical protein
VHHKRETQSVSSAGGAQQGGELVSRGVLHMHPSCTLHPPFTIKKLILSKRGGQREDEGRIFSISLSVHSGDGG